MKTSIEVKFESFTTESNWVNGECDGYHFEAKLYDEPSIFGIQKGRVSKLAIFRPSPDNSMCINYDRGWDMKPEKGEQRKVYRRIMALLESSPKRWD